MNARLALVALVCAGACDDTERVVDTSPGPPPGPPLEELRIVTLAPHLAELVFAVGAGDQLVGVSEYTDHPEAAAALPVIGDAFVVDQERLSVIRPHLLLAWESGTPVHAVDELRSRGYRVETIQTRSLADIAAALERIGALTGREAEARVVADAYRDGLDELSSRYADTNPIRVFYQVSARPLYTINGNHYVSELIELCGGTNIFADLNELAPVVAVEAVIDRDPEVMLASSDAGEDAFSEWRRWPVLAANRLDNHYFIAAAEIGRATPRLITGGEAMCERLEDGREKRRAYQHR